MSEDDKHLSKFLIDILGPAAKEIKELLGDWARYWRWKNLLSIREKFNTKCQEQVTFTISAGSAVKCHSHG